MSAYGPPILRSKPGETVKQVEVAYFQLKLFHRLFFFYFFHWETISFHFSVFQLLLLLSDAHLPALFFSLLRPKPLFPNCIPISQLPSSPLQTHLPAPLFSPLLLTFLWRPICSQNCRPDRAAPLFSLTAAPAFHHRRPHRLQQIVTAPVTPSGQQDRSITQPK